MYAMVVGKLPFTTPYTDQYRRQKLLQQIEKGLVDQHDREMAHLTSGEAVWETQITTAAAQFP